MDEVIQLHEPLWTKVQVCEFLQISRATLHRELIKGRLPKPIYVSASSPRWVPAEVRQWLSNRRS